MSIFWFDMLDFGEPRLQIIHDRDAASADVFGWTRRTFVELLGDCWSTENELALSIDFTTEDLSIALLGV